MYSLNRTVIQMNTSPAGDVSISERESFCLLINAE